jgi:diaminopimelate epimerase
VSVRFPGGTLQVERRDDGEVLLGGPMAKVFEAVVDLDGLT